MDNIFAFIIMGLFLYLIFFRKGGMGGMGCCGGHGDHGHGQTRPDRPSGKDPNQVPQQKVVDLRKDQYSILNPSDEKPV